LEKKDDRTSSAGDHDNIITEPQEIPVQSGTLRVCVFSLADSWWLFRCFSCSGVALLRFGFWLLWLLFFFRFRYHHRPPPFTHSRAIVLFFFSCFLATYYHHIIFIFFIPIIMVITSALIRND
jgi:hypothetical protein